MIKSYINDKTTTEGANIEFLTSQYWLRQIKSEQAHVLQENSSSYIDLIKTKPGTGFMCSSIFTPKLPS